MKKSLFVLGVAVAALASCTNEEVLNVAESNQIRFGTSFVGNQTKALTRADNNGHVAPDIQQGSELTEFYVYGKNNSSDSESGAADVFENVEVTKTATGSWDYTKHKQWEQKYYKFAAYVANAQLTTNTNVSFDWTNGLSFTDVTIDGDDNQYDFMASQVTPKDCSSTTPTDVDNATVTFSLDHLLSKIQFTLKSGFGKDVTVTISDFKFYNMKTQGDCSYSSDNSKWAWSNVDGEALPSNNTSFKHGDAVTAIGVAANATETEATNAVYSWLVIPQGIKGTNDSDPLEMVSFTATVTGMVGEEENQEIAKKTITAKLPATTWEANNVYNYNLVINETVMEMNSYIIFGTPTITDWNSTTTAVNVPADNITSTDIEEEP